MSQAIDELLMSSSWGSYPSIHNLGNAAIRDLLTVPCYVEEKVDGSQFSFGVFDDPDYPDGHIRIKSKNAEMFVDAPEKMFNKAAATVKQLAPLLHRGWTYRGEYLQSPSHNSLMYERVPTGHIMLFDISVGGGVFATRAELEAEAARIGLEVVPLLKWDTPSLEELRDLIDNQVAVLGGQKIEGVVIKQQQPLLWGSDKKLLIGKFVSERFREIHKQKWGENQPNQTRLLEKIAAEVCTTARWHKSVMRLREQGTISDTPRDIPLILKDVQQDIQKEETDHIKQRLLEYFWRDIGKLATRGLPEWYKQLLLVEQFTADRVLVDEGANIERNL